MLGEIENATIFAVQFTECLSGGIGRRAGFKIQFWQQSGGSIPPSGTRFRAAFALPKKAKKTHLEFTRRWVFCFLRTAEGSGRNFEGKAPLAGKGRARRRRRRPFPVFRRWVFCFLRTAEGSVVYCCKQILL